MSQRIFALLVAFVALVTLPYWMTGIYYVNVASQILFYAIFALGLNVLAGYGGLVSLGHAGLFGVTAYATGYMLQLGFGHTASIIAALIIGLVAMAIYAMLSLRSTGIGFIMITLALGEILWGLAYRWISLTGGDNGLSVKARPEPFGFSLADANTFYLRHFGRLPVVARRHGNLRALAAWRCLDGYARPAAPNERARLSRLGDPVLRLLVFRIAYRSVGHSVRLLHTVHQPADAGADIVRRGSADGDFRRRRHLARARSSDRRWWWS